MAKEVAAPINGSFNVPSTTAGKYVAYFSTDGGRVPPRSASRANVIPIVRSNPTLDANRIIGSLMAKWPHVCSNIFAPWKIHWFFDEYDFYQQGGRFLYELVLGRMQKDNEARLNDFIHSWSEKNKTNFYLVKILPIDRLFHQGDKDKYGWCFLERAKETMSAAFDRALEVEANLPKAPQQSQSAQQTDVQGVPNPRPTQLMSSQFPMSAPFNQLLVSDQALNQAAPFPTFVPGQQGFDPNQFPTTGNPLPQNFMPQGPCMIVPSAGRGPMPFPGFPMYEPIPQDIPPQPTNSLPFSISFPYNNSSHGHLSSPMQINGQHMHARPVNEPLLPNMPGHADMMRSPEHSRRGSLNRGRGRAGSFRGSRRPSGGFENKASEHSQQVLPVETRNSRLRRGSRRNTFDRCSNFQNGLAPPFEEQESHAISKGAGLEGTTETQQNVQQSSGDTIPPQTPQSKIRGGHDIDTALTLHSSHQDSPQKPESLQVRPQYIGADVHWIKRLFVKNGAKATEEEIREFFNPRAPVKEVISFIKAGYIFRSVFVDFDSTDDARKVLHACRPDDRYIVETCKKDRTYPHQDSQTSPSNLWTSQSDRLDVRDEKFVQSSASRERLRRDSMTVRNTVYTRQDARSSLDISGLSAEEPNIRQKTWADVVSLPVAPNLEPNVDGELLKKKDVFPGLDILKSAVQQEQPPALLEETAAGELSMERHTNHQASENTCVTAPSREKTSAVPEKISKGASLSRGKFDEPVQSLAQTSDPPSEMKSNKRKSTRNKRSKERAALPFQSELLDKDEAFEQEHAQELPGSVKSHPPLSGGSTWMVTSFDIPTKFLAPGSITEFGVNETLTMPHESVEEKLIPPFLPSSEQDLHHASHHGHDNFDEVTVTSDIEGVEPTQASIALGWKDDDESLETSTENVHIEHALETSTPSELLQSSLKRESQDSLTANEPLALDISVAPPTSETETPANATLPGPTPSHRLSLSMSMVTELRNWNSEYVQLTQLLSEPHGKHKQEDILAQASADAEKTKLGLKETEEEIQKIDEKILMNKAKSFKSKLRKKRQKLVESHEQRYDDLVMLLERVRSRRYHSESKRQPQTYCLTGPNLPKSEEFESLHKGPRQKPEIIDWSPGALSPPTQILVRDANVIYVRDWPAMGQNTDDPPTQLIDAPRESSRSKQRKGTSSLLREERSQQVEVLSQQQEEGEEDELFESSLSQSPAGLGIVEDAFDSVPVSDGQQAHNEGKNITKKRRPEPLDLRSSAAFAGKMEDKDLSAEDRGLGAVVQNTAASKSKSLETISSGEATPTQCLSIERLDTEASPVLSEASQKLSAAKAVTHDDGKVCPGSENERPWPSANVLSAKAANFQAKSWASVAAAHTDSRGSLSLPRSPGLARPGTVSPTSSTATESGSGGFNKSKENAQSVQRERSRSRMPKSKDDWSVPPGEAVWGESSPQTTKKE